MPVTVQQEVAQKAVEHLNRHMFSTVGNAAIKKVRVFRAPKGKHLAVIMTNSVLTVATEPVYSPVGQVPGTLKRRYAPNDARNSNLNFNGSKLGVGYSIDWWVFDSATDFDEFCHWYAKQA